MCKEENHHWNDTSRSSDCVVNTLFSEFLGKHMRVLTVLWMTCDGSRGLSSELHLFLIRQEKTLRWVLFISITIWKLGGIWGWVGLAGGIKNRYFVLWAHICFSNIFLAGSGEWPVKPCMTFLNLIAVVFFTQLSDCNWVLVFRALRRYLSQFLGNLIHFN